MENKLYELFDKCIDGNMDNTDDCGQLSKQEVTEIMQRFRTEIGENENKKRKKIKPAAFFVIAAAAAACIGTTAFATDRLGAFDKLKNVKDRTYITDDGREFPINKGVRGDYSKVKEAAVQPTKPVTNPAEEKSNININVEDIYCDGQMIMLGVTGSLADGNSTGTDRIEFGDMSLYINGEEKESTFANRYMVIDEGTDNSFTGSICIPLNEKDWFTETSEITVKFANVYVSTSDITEPTKIISASLTLNVTPDNSLLKKVYKTVEEDGYSMTIYTVSNAILTTDESMPREIFVQPNTRRRYLDGSGNVLIADDCGAMTIGSNENVMCWNTPDNTDSITVEFFNQVTGEIYKTLTVDLT